MKSSVFKAFHTHNHCADRGRAYAKTERAVVSLAAHLTAIEEISSWPEYAPTPLIEMAGLATELGLGAVHYKDEDKRFGLKSFKALGGAYAVLRVLQEDLAARHGVSTVSSTDLLSGSYRHLTEKLTVTAATDGNHGRSVAWGASMFGCACNIYLHSHVSDARESEIATFGAKITRVDGSYDDSVRDCAADAERLGRVLVADTNSGGGEAAIPALVMQGYTILAQEFMTQMQGSIPTHVFVQGGVGGIAAAIAGHLWESLGTDRPRIVVVEPGKANCIFRSIEAGEPTPVEGDVNTFMACLAAGEVSPLAWPILKYGADDVLTLEDDAAREAMRFLARGVGGDLPVVAGESGCAAVAGLLAASADHALASILELGPGAKVIVIGSEGATDIEVYRDVVGESPDDVARRAA
jgi:diaminopropionate ammonia-lyase